MADTLTVHYQMTMPEVGAASTTWGTSLNANLAVIDTQMYLNQNAGLPVGSIAMFAGVSAPANWLICDGSQISTTTYATLFAAIGTVYNDATVTAGNFMLPNLQGKFPIGAGSAYTLSATGGEATHVLTTAELPAHTHTITDQQHSHTIRNVLEQTGTGGHQGTTGAPLQSGTLTTDPASTGITGTNATGSGAAHNNLPPFLVLNFIIRAS